MGNYEALAQNIMKFAGGKNNITHVTNCMTRVRLIVSNIEKVDIEALKAMKEVYGVFVDAQVQIVVGPGTAAKVAAKVSELAGVEKSGGALKTETEQTDKEKALDIAQKNKQIIKSKQKTSKGKMFLKTISNIFIPLSQALIASGLLAGLQSVIVSLVSNGVLADTLALQECINILRVIKAGVLSYLVIHVGINAAKEFKTDINLGGALGAVVLLTGMSADAPIRNIFTGGALSSGQGGVIGVVAAVWVLAKIRKQVSKIMPEVLDLVLTPFISLTLSGLITLFLIMPVAGLFSDGILFVVTKLLQVGGVAAGFVLAGIWLPVVMCGMHHFMTPIHIELINQTGMTVVLPILAQAGAGQVGGGIGNLAEMQKE